MIVCVDVDYGLRKGYESDMEYRGSGLDSMFREDGASMVTLSISRSVHTAANSFPSVIEFTQYTFQSL